MIYRKNYFYLLINKYIAIPTNIGLFIMINRPYKQHLIIYDINMIIEFVKYGSKPSCKQFVGMTV